MLLLTDLLQKKGPGKLRKELLIGFDPVSFFLHQLQERFQGYASFCVDGIGGHVIGIKWSAKAREAAPFNVKTAHMLEPAEAESHGSAPQVQACTLSVSAVLTDIKALGAGLVRHVESSIR